MNTKQLYFLIAFFPFFNFLFSQTGPGGVGTTDGTSNLVLWLNPDESGNTNTLWKDKSGNNYNFNQGTGAQLNLNAVNGYHTYVFNGANHYFEKSHENKLNPNSFSVFSVNKVSSSSKYKTVLSSRDEYIHWFWPDKKYGFMLYAVPNSNNWSFWTGDDNSWYTSGDSQSTAGYWSIQNINYQNDDKHLFINNNLNANSNQGMLPNSERPFRVGAGKNENNTPDYFFKGDMGEIIMFDNVINEAQQIIVNNYLAAKYNLNIANDLYTQDNPVNGNFDHHVAGIGKVDNNNQHLSSQGTGIIRISKSGLGNNKFLFWGENNKNATYGFFHNSLGDYKDYIDTMWRVSEPNGINNKFTVAIKKTDLNITTDLNCVNLELVVANNPNFTGSSVRIYNLSDTGTEYVFQEDGLGFNDGDYFTLRYVSSVVWDGIGSFHNGSGVLNAPSLLDSCYKLVIKSGVKAVINNNAHVQQIVIEPGAYLELADGVALTVEKNIVNNGILDLLGEAQLIQMQDGVSQNLGSGKLIIRQQGTNNLYNYNYWCSPVNRNGSWQIGFLEQNGVPVSFHSAYNANPNTNPITLSNRWLYAYNASASLGYYGWNALSTTTQVLPGIGYTMKGSGTSNTSEVYEFSGEANNGTYNYPVTAGYDFLVGNPYPSGLNAKKFIEDNLDVTNGTLYFYEQFETNNTHNTVDYQGGYAVRNILAGVAAVSQLGNNGLSSKGAPKENIAVGQAFFVSIVNNGTLKFNNSQRSFAKQSSGDTVFYREASETDDTDNRIKFWLQFTDQDQKSQEIALGYDSHASLGFDPGYDAIDYNNYLNNMLWYTPENLLVIQGLNNFNIADEIPLSIQIANPGIFSIALSKTLNFPEHIGVYLKDNHESVFYNIKNESAILNLEAGLYNNRFSIVFQNSTLSTAEQELAESMQVIINKESGSLKLQGLKDINQVKTVSIYSLEGKQVMHFSQLESNTINVAFLSDGVYLLKLNMVKGSTHTVKFIKQ